MKKGKLATLLNRSLSKGLLFLISLYQRFVSPFTLPSCRYLPTCSDYAVQAIKKKGPFLGTYFSIKRLLSCHPFAKSRVDELK